MKYLSIIIIGCTFLLSGCIGLALDNLSEAVLLADSVVSSSSNSTLLHYLFIFHSRSISNHFCCSTHYL